MSTAAKPQANPASALGRDLAFATMPLCAAYVANSLAGGESMDGLLSMVVVNNVVPYLVPSFKQHLSNMDDEAINGVMATAFCVSVPTLALTAAGYVCDQYFGVPHGYCTSFFGAATLPILHEWMRCGEKGIEEARELFGNVKTLTKINCAALAATGVYGVCTNMDALSGNTAPQPKASECRLAPDAAHNAFTLSAAEMAARENAKGRTTIIWPGAVCQNNAMPL